MWIDCLNGDKYKTGKLTPEGEPDPSIFSTDFNREGIQVGTAIALLARRDRSKGTSKVDFRNLWGREKRAQLLENAAQESTSEYNDLSPAVEFGYSFQPGKVESGYLSWPLLPDLFPSSFPGVKTSRDDLLIDIDKERLVNRMKQYFDPDISDSEMEAISRSAMTSTKRFNARKTRRYLVTRGFNEDSVVRYSYRPFDDRWLYWEPEKKLLDEKREDYFGQVFGGNIWLEARQRQPMERFDRGYVVSALADNFGNGLSNFFPLYLKPKALPKTLFEHLDAPSATIPNVSDCVSTYLKSVDAEPMEFFLHCIAVLHSESYRRQNAGGLRLHWPRIPLPTAHQNLLASAEPRPIRCRSSSGGHPGQGRHNGKIAPRRSFGGDNLARRRRFSEPRGRRSERNCSMGTQRPWRRRDALEGKGHRARLHIKRESRDHEGCDRARIVRRTGIQTAGRTHV